MEVKRNINNNNNNHSSSNKKQKKTKKKHLPKTFPAENQKHVTDLLTTVFQQPLNSGRLWHPPVQKQKNPVLQILEGARKNLQVNNSTDEQQLIAVKLNVY